MLSTVRKALKRLMKYLFDDYELYRIFQSPDRSSLPIDPDVYILDDAHSELLASSESFRDLGQYLGDSAVTFTLMVGSELASVAVYWYGERYRIFRGFIRLERHEAKLIEIETAERFRGRGLAGRLIRASSTIMHQRGFGRLYARIWHNNRNSIRAFTKADWKQIAFVAGFRIGRRRIRFRLPLQFINWIA